MTKYNSDPKDQPDQKNHPFTGMYFNPQFWNSVKSDLQADMPKVRHTWSGVLQAATAERRQRLIDLNEQAKAVGFEIDLEDNPRKKMVLEVKYDLIHKQINAILDEHHNTAAFDPMKQTNISRDFLEKYTNPYQN